jgi:DNA-binding response OmpR family regulator
MDHRVLVADSDVSLATVYECYLESHGFDVAIATDGVDCFEMLQQFRPDFLVMESDILWGGADGVLGYLRSGDGVHSTSVILVADAPPDELP